MREDDEFAENFFSVIPNSRKFGVEFKEFACCRQDVGGTYACRSLTEEALQQIKGHTNLLALLLLLLF